jgi:hypothetical protein
MSIPGLNGVAPDIANAIGLAQSAAPQSSGSSVSSAPATPPADTAAQAALNEILNGATPSDASIGLYSAAPDAALAANRQATDILQKDMLQQDLASNAQARATLAADLPQLQNEAATVQRNGTALADIENSLKAAVFEAKQAACPADLHVLLQAVDAGASEAAALAGRLQAAQSEARAFNPTAVAAGWPQNETVAGLSALVENLVAMTQAGDMSAAAVFAQAIRLRMGETAPALPPGWLAALAAASAQGLAPPPDVAADPLLQAYQASLIIGLRTTLDKLRKLREDRMKILAALALEEGRTREDEQA